MLIAKSVQRLEPYVPGEQPKARNVVKLNTNENPYPPSPKCAEVLRGFDLDRLRRYPDPEFAALRKAIGRLNGCDPSRVFVGNGSDEILSLAAKAFVEDDGAIGSLDPSYSLYKTLAAIRDVAWVGVEKTELTGWKKNLQDSAQAVAHNPVNQKGNPVNPVSLFLFTNPNAPTGEFAEPEEIAKFAKAFKGVVIVDEAYADFARDNCMRLATAEGNRNLIVMRTFSKSYSLAGLRVGYCVGPQELIDALYKVKDSYNVDAVAQAVALAAIKDQRWMKANTAKIRKTRRWFAAELARRGWDVIPSESNFVFARPPTREEKTGVTGLKKDLQDSAQALVNPVNQKENPVNPVFFSAAAGLFAYLKTKNIFVRYFKGPKTGDRLRITIGTDEQMTKLLAALDSLSKSRTKH